MTAVNHPHNEAQLARNSRILGSFPEGGAGRDPHLGFSCSGSAQLLPKGRNSPKSGIFLLGPALIPVLSRDRGKIQGFWGDWEVFWDLRNSSGRNFPIKPRDSTGSCRVGKREPGRAEFRNSRSPAGLGGILEFCSQREDGISLPEEFWNSTPDGIMEFYS